jgi:hypothetical protein
MPQSSQHLVQLVTRIPYDLRRRAKIHCTQHDLTLTQFVIDAIVERLHAEASRGARGRASHG